MTTPYPAITFLSLTEAQDVIDQDADGFIRSLRPHDLQARHASSIMEYWQRISAALVDVSTAHQQIITRTIVQLIQRVTRWQKANGTSRWRTYPLGRWTHEPWCVALFRGSDYEFGYPHTRGSVIFLPVHLVTLEHLPTVLLHEQIHVLQKKYRLPVLKWLRATLEVVPIKRLDEQVAANPDLDPFAYPLPSASSSSCSSVWMGAHYQKFVRGERHVTPTDPRHEHPLEWIAYELTRPYKAMEQWCRRYVEEFLREEAAQLFTRTSSQHLVLSPTLNTVETQVAREMALAQQRVPVAILAKSSVGWQIYYYIYTPRQHFLVPMSRTHGLLGTVSRVG